MANRLSKVVKKTSAKKQKPVPVKIVSDTASAPSAVDDMKWRARDALSTLSRAEEIRRDKSLMKAVKTEAKQQVKSLSSVCKR